MGRPVNGWWPPRTWVAAESPTAAEFNTFVRDNQNVLLAACRVYSTSTGAVSAGTSGATAWMGAQTDELGMWVPATSLHAIVPGRYRVTGRWGGSSVAAATLSIRKNGQDTVLSGFGTGMIIVPEYDVQLAYNDYLELMYEIGASDYTLATTVLPVGGISADMSMRWVAP